MRQSWETYYKNRNEGTPRDSLVRAVEKYFQGDNQGKIAWDLGAGVLDDSKYLLDKGFSVVAVDSSEAVRGYAPKVSEYTDFELKIETIQSFVLLTSEKDNKPDLVSAQLSLPFITNDLFVFTMEHILDTLKTEGIFTGQLFGKKDDWNTLYHREDMNFHTKEGVTAFFTKYISRNSETLEILLLNEEEKDAVTVEGEPKHWDIIDFTVKKVKKTNLK